MCWKIPEPCSIVGSDGVIGACTVYAIRRVKLFLILASGCRVIDLITERWPMCSEAHNLVLLV